MARKTLTYTVTDKGRDQGKVFVITEMPASQAERWATRALFALMNSGVEIPDNIASAGLAGVASLGIQSLGKLPFELAEPLLEGMFGCVAVMPDPGQPNVTRRLIEDDIEEVATRVKLRMEIFKLHVDFFTAGALSIQAPAPAGTTLA